jgi:hypothetical protein
MSIQCVEVYESVQRADGRVEYEWVWCVLGDGERRFVAGPHDAPAGARIVRRGES